MTFPHVGRFNNVSTVTEKPRYRFEKVCLAHRNRTLPPVRAPKWNQTQRGVVPSEMKTYRALVITLLIAAGCNSGTDAATDRTQVPETSSASTTQPVRSATASPNRLTTDTNPAPERPEATCLGADISQPPDTALTFYAQCGGSWQTPYPIYRPGRTTPTLEQSLTNLLEGTTPDETALGLYTGFDMIDTPADVEVSASIAGGIAHVEFLRGAKPWLPDTSQWTSDQLNSLLDPLLATVFATDEVLGLDMTTLCFEQVACGDIVTRAEWSGLQFMNTGSLLHDCTLEAVWWYPDLCTLEGALSGPTAPATVVNVAADDTLKVRAGPGSEFFQVGELAPRATVSVADQAAVASDGGVWQLIDSESASAGWVNRAWLDVSRSETEDLVDTFIAFALAPSDATYAELPIADTVDLGLGPTIIKTVDAAELRSPESWQVDLDYFRAYVGPFSAFEALNRLRIYDVTIGDHAHCVSAPVPAPDGYESLQRISVQPRLGLQSSCLMWDTVDFFVLANGDVVAITYDLWEP